ncbi:MAG: aminotransferase class I/II-fold pyridoxal phosphate-dependent enzyme, partial [Bdellovibrionales bacterium]|nr:aminotransferase class I/II-fold pyridoxal phosphate-dependent enzyme [Bdellovibrionales bacterium]
MTSLAPRIKSASFELSAIKAMEIAASKIPGAISLAQGIPSFETPQQIKNFVYDKLREGACDKYSLTNGIVELREQIAASLHESGMFYDPETEIIVTAGSIEGISATLLAFLQPGDEVIIPSPTYTSYQGCIQLAGGVPKFAELDEERNFDLNLDAI